MNCALAALPTRRLAPFEGTVQQAPGLPVLRLLDPPQARQLAGCTFVLPLRVGLLEANWKRVFVIVRTWWTSGTPQKETTLSMPLPKPGK